jgi:uncharacterized protein YlxW (UPF0749 family)
MIDTSFSTAALPTASGADPHVRQGRSADDAVALARLQDENRDLRAEQRRLAAQNGALQREVADLQREITRSDRVASADSTSGTLLDVYA